MTLLDLKNELIHWKFSKYKLINFSIGLTALLILEFIARPYYRPYIYSHHINDFHIADTLGNSLGTVATIFIPIALLTNDGKFGLVLIKLLTISVIIYEIGHPLLGKPIDPWDIVATILTGTACFLLFKKIFKA